MTPGTLIGLVINGAFTSCETQCQINFNQEMLPSSAVDSGGWKEFLAGIRSWTISVNGNLLLDVVGNDIKSLITTGYIKQLPMYAQFSTYPSSTVQLRFSGEVYFNTASITAAATGAATWTAQLQGSGELVAVYNNFPLLINAMPVEADYPTIVDESQIF